MDTRVVLIGIIVEDANSVEKINAILHDVSEYVIGRMGVPYRAKGVNIISIILDAPEKVISSVSGKLGQLQGVSVKAIYSKV